MPETLDASTVPAEDLEQVATLAAALPQGSPMAVVLQHLVVSLSKGQDVAVFETEEHLTPNQAAELLHMSRPHLLKFMDSGDLKWEPVGSHRRIPMSELLDFIDRRERAKAAVAHAYGTPGLVDKYLRDSAAGLSKEDIAALDAIEPL